MAADIHRGSDWVPSFVEFSQKKADDGVTDGSQASGCELLEYVGEMSAAMSYASDLHGYHRLSALLDAVVAEAASSRGKGQVVPLPSQPSSQTTRNETK